MELDANTVTVILNRLSRAQGHVVGVIQMLEEGWGAGPGSPGGSLLVPP
ncbi:MAG: metal-sensing transcriptional repressor [Actinomycetota bacterium]|nr:metal-sensing transcriptional repressor [Actinomycetota bacterium]MDP2288134.1 metal-sensing transcriptional repressor [Actinomycetota bacterium]